MQMELSPSSFASPGSNSPRVDATWRLAWTFQQNALRCCRTDAETADGATAFGDLRVLADQPALFGKVAPVPTTCRAAGVGRRLWLSIPVESALERTWFSDLYQISYKSELNPRRTHEAIDAPALEWIASARAKARAVAGAAGELGHSGFDLQCQFRLTQPGCQSILTGMDIETLGANLSSDDPAIGLRASLALHRLAERVEANQVAAAREKGWSWQQIGDALGVTRQSVHTKYNKESS